MEIQDIAFVSRQLNEFIENIFNSMNNREGTLLTTLTYSELESLHFGLRNADLGHRFKLVWNT